MVGHDESLDETVASPAPKDAAPKDIAALSERYETAISQLVAKLVAERNALETDNIQLQKKLRELKEQAEKDTIVWADFKEKAVTEITSSRTKCQKLEDKLRSAEAALAANEKMAWQDQKQAANEVFGAANKEDENTIVMVTTEQDEVMVLSDDIVTHG